MGLPKDIFWSLSTKNLRINLYLFVIRIRTILDRAKPNILKESCKKNILKDFFGVYQPKTKRKACLIRFSEPLLMPIFVWTLCFMGLYAMNRRDCVCTLIVSYTPLLCAPTFFLNISFSNIILEYIVGFFTFELLI